MPGSCEKTPQRKKIICGMIFYGLIRFSFSVRNRSDLILWISIAIRPDWLLNWTGLNIIWSMD